MSDESPDSNGNEESRLAGRIKETASSGSCIFTNMTLHGSPGCPVLNPWPALL